jgi:hypothetical protein
MKTTIIGKGRRLNIDIQLTQLGEQKPYFSITANVYEATGKPGRPALLYSGCCHGAIQAITSHFDDVIALHLSDINGVPMHAVANGAYWMGDSKYQMFDATKAKAHFRCNDEELKEAYKAMKENRLADYVNTTFVPRWKQEADAVIQKYKLTIKKER